MKKRIGNRELGVLILAAGKGTRMESNKAKVLHHVAGQPMLSYVLGVARKLKPSKLVVVVGHQGENVRQYFSNGKDIRWVFQKEMKGTGHAVQTAAFEFENFSSSILILYGDIPGIRIETLRRLRMVHDASQNTITLLTAELDDPTGYGRVIVGPDGSVVRIVEDKDAALHEKEITEVNTGIGLYEPQFLFSSVFQLQPTNRQQELYLTDLIADARKQGKTVGRMRVKDAGETLGINNRSDLAEVSRFFEELKISQLLESGVTLLDPNSTIVEPTVQMGKDITIGSQVVIKGQTQIASEVIIDSDVQIVESLLRNRVYVSKGVSMSKVKVDSDTFIGTNTTLGR